VPIKEEPKIISNHNVYHLNTKQLENVDSFKGPKYLADIVQSDDYNISGLKINEY
jgi:hypothetical protein